jgi:hypothetical protein
MSITPWIPTVNKIANGDDVSAEVVNPILAQHTQREQHLYEKFATVANKSVLIAYEQPLLPDTQAQIKENHVVYYHRKIVNEVPQEGLTLAQTAFEVTVNSSAFTTKTSAYCFGLVKSIYNTKADVYLVGLVELTVNIDNVAYGLIQSDECAPDSEFEPGPFFLSRTEAGKITRNPGGVAIYVGYALNRTSFLFAPNVSEFNQFFTTYKFNILDRPIGKPKYVAGHWTIENPDTTRVGWIGVDDLTQAQIDIAPVGAKFFYNLPADIESDTGIDVGTSKPRRLEQIELAKALPPNPPNLTFLTVNGIVQADIQSDSISGTYKVDDLGIWWFSDLDGQQPWAEDLIASLPFTIDATSDKLTFNNDHKFELADRVKLLTTGLFPDVDGGDDLNPDTDYYVVEIPENNTIKLGRVAGGGPIDFTSTGSGTLSIPQPYIWKFSSGSEEQRPKTYLQFLKFNPALKEGVVTSLKKFYPNSNILKFYKNNFSTTPAIESSVGDLYAKVFLEFLAGTPVSNSATAIKTLEYVESTGKVTVTNTPVVSVLEAGAGITLTSSGEGRYIVSSSSNSTSGVVSNIEPDGAELIYSGLHSYINMTVPSVLPSKILGKILLPYSIPNNDLTFVMLLMANETTLVAKNVDFDFRYSISKPGTVLGSTIFPTTLSFALPAKYTAKTVLKVGNTAGAIPLPAFKIPAAQISGGDCAVNFELFRKRSETSPLDSVISIIDIYWKIG